MIGHVFTCERCGWHRLPDDRSCAGCRRLDEQEREKARAEEGPDSRYLRIVDGRRTYSDGPPPDTIFDPHARKSKLKKENYS